MRKASQEHSEDLVAVAVNSPERSVSNSAYCHDLLEGLGGGTPMQPRCLA